MGMYLTAECVLHVRNFMNICKQLDLPLVDYDKEDCIAVITKDKFTQYQAKMTELVDGLACGKKVGYWEMDFMCAFTVIHQAYLDKLCGSEDYDPPWEDLVFV